MEFTDLIDDYEGDPYSTVEQDAGYILSDNLQDRSFRSGLSLAGWKPGNDMEAQAVEWWEFDWEYGQSPVGDTLIVYSEYRADQRQETSSQEFSIVNYVGFYYCLRLQRQLIDCRTRPSINTRMRTTTSWTHVASMLSYEARHRPF